MKRGTKVNMNNWKIFEDHLQMQEMIYTRRIGAYGSENAVRMEQFKEWIAGQGYMSPDAVILGIARDNAETTLPENCRYDICLIGSYETDVDWIQKGILEGGRYVVIQFPHTAEAMRIVWQDGFSHLMQAGYHLDFSRPVIERYRKKLVDRHLCEMMFPIK